MSSFLRSVILVMTAAMVINCAGPEPIRWGNLHGNSASQGFQSITSGFALSSSWISNPYRITGSSPVIGMDAQRREVLYIGTTNAKLVAIRSEDGTEKWQRRLGAVNSNTRIVSSASVSDKGDIYIIANHQAEDGRFRSTLHKVDQNSNVKWSFSFPDNGYTTGSPKVLTASKVTYVFVYISTGMIDDVRGEVFVLRDDRDGVTQLDRQALGSCPFSASESPSEYADIMAELVKTREMIERFPVKMQTGGTDLPDRFIDPTVAVVADTQNPLIAIADNLCSIGVFEWNGQNLNMLWRLEHRLDKHSSASIMANGMMIFGREDGKVLAYDVKTGVKMWEYDAGQAVFATPAGSPDQHVFIVSKDQLQVLNAPDGTLVQDANFSGKLPLMGTTHASPAVTANLVYVSSLEMLTATHDLKTRASDTNFRGNGFSSIAIGRDGAVYAVAVDGTIRKYAGTE